MRDLIDYIREENGEDMRKRPSPRFEPKTRTGYPVGLHAWLRDNERRTAKRHVVPL